MKTVLKGSGWYIRCLWGGVLGTYMRWIWSIHWGRVLGVWLGVGVCLGVYRVRLSCSYLVGRCMWSTFILREVEC